MFIDILKERIERQTKQVYNKILGKDIIVNKTQKEEFYNLIYRNAKKEIITKEYFSYDPSLAYLKVKEIQQEANNEYQKK